MGSWWTRAAAVASAVVLPVIGLQAAAHAVPGSSYTWVGSSQDSHADNHSWTDPLNWSPQGVPGDGDSVAIAPPDGNHCVAHVDNVPGGLTLQDFSLTVGGLCGASVTGGSLTVDGVLSWDSGVIDTPITLASGAVGDVVGAVDGNPRKQLTQDLVVGGTLNLTGALVQIYDPHTITVNPGGTVRSTGTTNLTLSACCVTPARVVNNGTLTVADGSMTMTGIELDQLARADLARGTTLQVTRTPMTAGDGASYTGKGTLQLWNGVVARLAGNQKLGKGFHFQLGNDGTGGSILGGAGAFSGKGEFDWTGGTVMADLTVAHTVTVHVYGANTGNGKRYLSGQDSSGGGSVPVTFVNHGRMVVDQQAGFTTAQTANLVVEPDGSLSLAPGTQLTTMSCCVNPSGITNTGGTVSVPADADGLGPAVLSGVAYRATGGTTQIASGSELDLTGRPQSVLDSTTIAGGGRLGVQDPTTVADTVTLAGATSLRLAAGWGSLDGTATIAGSGSLDWVGGSLSGALTLQNTGGLQISGPDPKYVANVGGGAQTSTVDVAVPVTIAKGTAKVRNLLDLGRSTMTVSGRTKVAKNVEINGGSLVNTGTMTVAGGKKGSVLADYNLTLTNQGTFTLASGTLTSNGSFVQAGGTTTVSPKATLAAPYSSHAVTVNGGALTGSGTIAGALVNNAGTVDPGSVQSGTGTLTVTGNYTQAAGGWLAFDIAASRNDVLSVGGQATVAGVLASRTADGYTPKVGDTKSVLTAGTSLTWSVTCAVTSGQGSDTGHWEPAVSGTSLTVVWKAGSQTTC